MAANASPRFTKNGNVSWVSPSAANTKSDGTGTIATDIFKAFTADATNGSFVERVRWSPTASVAATTTTATVARVFLSSIGSGATTTTTTVLIAEISLPATAADHSTNAVPFYDVLIGITIPPGYFLLVTNHAAPAANTAWRAVVIGGDY